MTTKFLTTDSDVLTAADQGKLFRVENGEAFPWSRQDIERLGLPFGHLALELDDTYGRNWIFARAESAKEAVEIAGAYDANGLWEVEVLCAVCWADGKTC